MENLNKENFFNEMQQKYPDAMNLFCEWIDKYKKEVCWDELFNAGEPYSWHDTGRVIPKFHDIPIEMQMGILIRFGNEILDAVGSTEELVSNIKEAAEETLFVRLQNKLKPTT